MREAQYSINLRFRVNHNLIEESRGTHNKKITVMLQMFYTLFLYDIRQIKELN